MSKRVYGYLDGLSGAYVARRLLDLDGLATAAPETMPDGPGLPDGAEYGLIETASRHVLRAAFVSSKAPPSPAAYLVPVAGGFGAGSGIVRWNWLSAFEFALWVSEVNAVVDPVPPVVIEPLRAIGVRRRSQRL